MFKSCGLDSEMNVWQFVGQNRAMYVFQAFQATLYLVFISLIGLSPIIAFSGGQTESELNVKLRVSVDNKIFDPGKTFQLKLGESVQSKVEIVDEKGGKKDITNDPKTTYFSMTPKVLSVSKTGVITAASELIDSTAFAKSDIGMIAISYGLTSDKDKGATVLMFEVSE